MNKQRCHLPGRLLLVLVLCYSITCLRLAETIVLCFVACDVTRSCVPSGKGLTRSGVKVMTKAWLPLSVRSSFMCHVMTEACPQVNAR